MAALTPDLPRVEAAIVDMTNLFRREQGRSEVRRNAVLDAAARAFATYMARTGSFSHTADGRQPADRAKAKGYAYCQIAENLALNLDSRGFETRQLARQAVEGWKDSPGHRKNLLAEHVVEIGVGVAKAPGEEKYLSVQLFGRPEALKYKFSIRNTTDVTVHYGFAGDSHDLGPSVQVTHTACMPGALSFDRAGSMLLGQTMTGRFPVTDGDTYVVARDRKGAVKVTHQPRVN